MASRIEIKGQISDQIKNEVLTAEALAFVEALHLQFNPKRTELLNARIERQKQIDSGVRPTFLESTREIREGSWMVAPAPQDLNDRRVEITGPVERKMMINALNSGAKVFMADIEDALSPRWDNVIQGQLNLKKAVRREIDFSIDGKEYKLNREIATLVVRPRGWHLEEANVLVDGNPISASLFDFGLHFFHNAKELLRRGSGPYFYLPKLESHLEARLWNNVFIFAQQALGVPVGSVRATVLIETITAAFEMEEILYELKEHASGLNAGRWDYIFSLIKRFRNFSDLVLPDRHQVTMAVPFMRAYSQLLVKSCHRHGAHAIGGMSAFIPNRRKPEITERALAQVETDKRREAGDGFDGTWVAHPDLVNVAMKVFDAQLGATPHQKHVQREDVQVSADQLLMTKIDGAAVTEDGLRTNARVALEYIANWLDGLGAVAINDLMEDAATAEISRAQIWQWMRHGIALTDGQKVDATLYKRIRDEELAKLQGAKTTYPEAARILDELVLKNDFSDFLTSKAYPSLGLA